MPSIAAHFACADLVYKRIKKIIKNKDDFYRGCILPDIIDKDNSHYKIKGKYYMVPDINRYIKEFDLSSDLNKGYLCHLILDKYFLDEFVITKIKNYDKIPLFSPDLIYNDYTNLNARLVKLFNLDLEYINNIMKNFKEKLREDKYELNINSINYLEEGELKYINLDQIAEFIYDASLRIAKEIKEVRI